MFAHQLSKVDHTKYRSARDFLRLGRLFDQWKRTVTPRLPTSTIFDVVRSNKSQPENAS